MVLVLGYETCISIRNGENVFTEILGVAMPEQAEKLKRLTIDLTGEEHRVLKAHAAEAGVSMRDLVLEVLRREGLLTRTKQGARR
jgi:hypothetical protein